ncbi:GNAT family N-acetyltransferase [Aestuariibacter halophilus]|uniref:GNAT family N-acetyltransferase n=1 Tax=Fluctibacter halophilus TaxID=226011 RepID=A0ABS8G406_9ALTE|nr:GNAT family N-acetyltransferase [Aestuariibacter halophilus]MCC2615327.1 GNAT family N-acetyltransferase [Aestuariibacter halophilus]
MTFTVENVDWGKAKHKLSKLREKVFVYEWRIPRECEFDNRDSRAAHVLLLDESGHEVATGRITPDGEIGRIAVESNYRKPAVYQVLIDALLDIARAREIQQVSVQCELEGVEYYQQQGFRPVGAVYMDAGIPRQRMACALHSFTLPRVDLTH